MRAPVSRNGLDVRWFSLLVACSLLEACGPGPAATFGPHKVDIPVYPGRPSVSATTTSSSDAPPSGHTKDAPFPAVARARLANGMGIAVVTSRALPIVQLRVVVRVGAGFGPSPAVASITADMLKDGGTRAYSSAELLRRIETLGADLSIATSSDATTLAMAVTKDHLGDALSLLSQVVREPRFDDGELKKLKARATDEAEDAARASGAWGATRMVFRELFPERSTYATSGLVPSEIARVDGAAIRDLHRRFYVPKATSLVLAGDVDEATAKTMAEKAFGSWAGGDPPKVEPAAPRLPEKTRVIVVHRPKSAQSDVYVATLAPRRRDPAWASVRVANQVLGGGVAGRLFSDVREQRSLAYRTNTSIFEVAATEQPLVAYAGTQTEKTSAALAGLLENIEKMTTSPPTTAETFTARRFLSDTFAIRMETIGSIADMVATQDVLGLPDGYWDAYRRELRGIETAQAEQAAKQLFVKDRLLVVVAGDADVVAQDLARFGDVAVVDPEKEFKPMRTIPQVTK
ncbi:MAG: insulinase family protein [Deltaproteobacteria bacterium]|nr:insulinase family protein [Deltaproteobacteria bacterium]